MSVAAVIAAFDAFDTDVVENAIPWLVLASGLDVTEAPPSVQAVMVRFAEHAGLTPGMEAPAVSAAVASWFQANPLPPPLLTALAAVARDLVASDDNGGQRAAAARVLGDTAAKLPVGAQPTPAGAMKNSPLARFTMTVPKKP